MNGEINQVEFKQVLRDVGKRDVTEEQVAEMFALYDTNSSGTIEWDEFLHVFTLISHNLLKY